MTRANSPSGRYHADDKLEEEEAARLAREILEEAGFKMADIGHGVRALHSLYNSGARRNRLPDIVHDADFLSKFGYVGVANFFVKSTLRGRNLESAVMDYLSKELTYAACLPRNMRTRAGQRLARKKSRESLRFFGSLLEELKEAGVADLFIRTVAIASGVRPRNSVDVRIAAPKSCPACGAMCAPACPEQSRRAKGLSRTRVFTRAGTMDGSGIPPENSNRRS